MNVNKVHRLIDHNAKYQALLLGGLVAIFPQDPEFVSQMTRGVDKFRRLAHQVADEEESKEVKKSKANRLGNTGPLPSKINLKPHPAIQELLRRCSASRK
jgi:hypothetical protein